jgi:hypothetical protein
MMSTPEMFRAGRRLYTLAEVREFLAGSTNPNLYHLQEHYHELCRWLLALGDEHAGDQN